MNIDPLDVTKVFIKRNDELIIKVVLVNYRELILGVVCILSIDTLFIAAEGVGAFKLDHSSGSSFQNAYPISVVRVDNM